MAGLSRKTLRADDDALTTCSLLLVHMLVLGRAVGRVVRVPAAGAAAVELNAITSARDTIAFARAAAAAGADAGRARAVG